MTVHVFATYDNTTFLVRADSEQEAKGLTWDLTRPHSDLVTDSRGSESHDDVETTMTVEYVGTVDDVLGDEQVTKVTPPIE